MHLPRSFFCYQPPKNSPQVDALPAQQNGHVTFGSIHNLFKLKFETGTQLVSYLIPAVILIPELQKLQVRLT
jgi:hypothetical protein